MCYCGPMTNKHTVIQDSKQDSIRSLDRNIVLMTQTPDSVVFTHSRLLTGTNAYSGKTWSRFSFEHGLSFVARSYGNGPVRLNSYVSVRTKETKRRFFNVSRDISLRTPLSFVHTREGAQAALDSVSSLVQARLPQVYGAAKQRASEVDDPIKQLKIFSTLAAYPGLLAWKDDFSDSDFREVKGRVVRALREHDPLAMGQVLFGKKYNTPELTDALLRCDSLSRMMIAREIRTFVSQDTLIWFLSEDCHIQFKPSDWWAGYLPKILSRINEKNRDKFFRSFERLNQTELAGFYLGKFTSTGSEPDLDVSSITSMRGYISKYRKAGRI